MNARHTNTNTHKHTQIYTIDYNANALARQRQLWLFVLLFLLFAYHATATATWYRWRVYLIVCTVSISIYLETTSRLRHNSDNGRIQGIILFCLSIKIWNKICSKALGGFVEREKKFDRTNGAFAKAAKYSQDTYKNDNSVSLFYFTAVVWYYMLLLNIAVITSK